MMALRSLTSMFSACRLTPISPFLPCVTSRQLNLPPSIPQQIMHQHKYEPYKTPEHHNSPEHMRLLKEELLDYPPYQNRKIRHGFQDAIMVRDYKRRMVASHFAQLRVRLNAIRKNNLLPQDIRDTASVQLHSLPRDSCFTRIMTRCVVTSRRRGCKTRWRVSRIIFRSLADYNRLSGAQWAIWMYNTFSTRRHMLWPPPPSPTPSAIPYVQRYHRNIAD
ncbi:unnamed protein product [Hymenolepis diminuta]|uniref:28S ribosomal protein S14, mitochondrial n=1 Tax=Hymenolepis diminuta TaxID=6216 RepID=A0A0R3STW0_HYMDI|nr:unnamed protein product [Hymenolepis diminuta]VUZ56221.1 unnamed protein product [Hymenolepis diminuta]